MGSVKRIIIGVVMFTLLGGVAMAGAIGPPESLGPPNLPGPFANFAAELQANRGNSPVIQVTVPPAANVPTIMVKDGAGMYQATFRQGTNPLPSILTQMDWNSNKATVWPVDPDTGQIAGPASQTTYGRIGYAKPGPNDPTTIPSNPKVPGATLSVVHKQHLAGTTKLMGYYNVLSDFCVQNVVAPTLVIYFVYLLDAETTISCIEPAEAIIAGQIEQAWFDYRWHNLNGASSVGGNVYYSVWIGTGIISRCDDVGASGEYPFRTHGWGFVVYLGHVVPGNGYNNLPNPVWPCENSDQFTGIDPG